MPREQISLAPVTPAPAVRSSSFGIAVRLFLTCWLIYALHLATNTVREIYLTLSIGDHLSFRLDEYANMHPDIFEKPGYGWHHGANPGASMIAAIPYALARPLIHRVTERVNQERRASGNVEPPGYRSQWHMARDFYAEAWRRGYDVKFGLAALVTQALCMAPFSAFGVVAMFWLLRRLFNSDRTALWLSIIYAVGTPVFFRTGYLNHNLMLGHIAFLGFLALWNPLGSLPWRERTRWLLGGLAGGAALLMDYSGIVLLSGLFLYALVRWPDLRTVFWYGAGASAPVGLLWFYQWRSFGHPLYPGQHWMPAVEWIEAGYQGFTLPQLELLSGLAFDYRYGLFTSCPLFLLALAAPWVNRGLAPRRELTALLGFCAGFFLFCGGISYTRLQFNTGIRYLAPILPFLFVPAAIVLMRLPRRLAYLIAVGAVFQAWCMAMYRDVESGLGLLEPILRVFVGGLQLPALTVFGRMGTQYGDYAASGVSPLPLFLCAAAVLFGIWSPWFSTALPVEAPLRDASVRTRAGRAGQ